MMLPCFVVFLHFLTFMSKAPSLAAVQNEPTEVRVLFLQKSGTPSAASFARLETPFPDLNGFTVCYRLRLHRFREESTLMSYAVSNEMDNELRMDHRTSGYKVSVHSTWAKTKILTPLSQWSHYCIVFDSDSDGWKIYVDGVLKARGKLPRYDGILQGNGAYIIGQEQDSLGGSFQRDQSFSGEIAELNFWSSTLSDREIRKIAGCDSFVEGDILAWSKMEWTINGEAEWIMRKRESFCEASSRIFTLFPTRLSLEDALKLCQVVGGRVAVPQNDQENKFVYDNSVENAGYCSSNLGWSYMWLGATDIDEERVWKYATTNVPIQWEGSWRGNGPNGGTVENCMVMLYGDFEARWSDIACLETYYFCTPCEFETRVLLHLKGPAMCNTSPFNYEYFLEGKRNNKPMIAGTLHSEMYWENTTQSWLLKSLKDNKALLKFIPQSSAEYPFGKRSWVVERSVCGYSEGTILNMTLSACGLGKFTCQDGSCISLEKRCDLRQDCEDQSDEADCTLVDFPDGYKNIIPPPPTSPPEPLNISFILNIISFPAIRTQDLTFETTFKLSLLWKDTRLTYLNLKKQRTLNLLSTSEVTNIWVPKIFFQNAFGNIFTNTEEGSRVECIPQGKSKPGPKSTEEESNIFSGSETKLDMSQYYSASYSCDFDLLMFPFDAQLCAMHFTLISASDDHMILNPDAAKYTGSRNLIEYAIGDLVINTTVSSNFSTVIITVRFMRRYGFYLLTLYIPSVLLVTIAYATLFFNPADFNSRIVVALTALLVLSSLFTQTSNSLPKTSYFKLVDIWLFFSTLIIFFVVLFQTLAEYHSYESLSEMKSSPPTRILKIGSHPPQNWLKEPNPKDKKIKIFGFQLHIFFLYSGRICIPLIYGIFNLAYWGSSISYLQENVWPYETNVSYEE